MSDLVLEDWEIDFPMNTGRFYFAWTETIQIRVDVLLEYDVDCEWKYFNGRDYEECTPIAEIASYTSTLQTIHPRSGDVMSEEEDNDLSSEDYEAMLNIIRAEYKTYLEEIADDY